ncbi:MAG: Bug family tripartite tricarboxylate transporter substrate binding protein [Burkholderiales bacterium]
MKRLQNFRSGFQFHAATLFLTIALSSVPALSHAQSQINFPERPVRLLVANPAGGTIDLIARTVAQGLAEIWGQPVLVENRAGAAGLIAGEIVAKAPGDGHTLFMGANSLTSIPFLIAKMPYDTLTDLVPIGIATTIPNVLVASPALKVESMAELVKAAKAQPGTINYASNGIGATNHISMEQLQREAGMTLNHIPYKGAAALLPDLVAGRVSLTYAAVSTMLPYIKEGKLVALGMASQSRSPLFPGVPTMAELGYPKASAAAIWVGLLGSKGMPQALVQKISKDFEIVVRSKAYNDNVIAKGNELRVASSEEFAQQIRSEFASNRELFKSLGIKPGG